MKAPRAIDALAEVRETKEMVIARVNNEYAVVLAGNKTAILKESVDHNGKFDWRLLSVGSFRLLLAPEEQVQQGKKLIPLADYWLGNKARRYYEGVVFDPSKTTPRHYNLWRGFAVEPRKGDCSLFLDHLRNNVCQGGEPLYQWVFAWFADIFQNPGKKKGTALGFRGKQGVGKTIVAKWLGHLLGPHYWLVSKPRHVTGNFNSRHANLLLLCPDEAFWAGDKTAEGIIRDQITGDSQTIEFKGFEPFEVPNHMRVLILGNAQWLVPAGMDERRICTLDVGEGHKQDHAYFAAIEEQLENGGAEALLYELLHVDLSQVNLRVIPTTDALLDQKISSMDSKNKWWLDVLWRGWLPKGCQAECESPTTAVFSSYIESAQKQGVTYKAIETEIGIFLNKLFGATLKKKDGEYKTPPSFFLQQGKVYEFPALADCRALFAKCVQQDIPWPAQARWLKAPEDTADGKF